MDSFDSCPTVTGTLEASAPHYCILSVNIDDSKGNSKLYDFIKKISEKKLNFKHDRLKRGICVKTCLDLHEKLDDPNKYKNDDAQVVGINPVDGMMNAYNKAMNVCINKKLKDKHGLLARTSIDNCVGKNQLKTLDYTEIVIEKAFISAFSLVIFLLVASLTYEWFKLTPRVVNFSKRFTRTRRLLDVFSVKQNWKKLVGGEPNDLADLSSLHASKLLIMFLFVIAHVYRVIVAMPFANPQDVEKVLTDKCFSFHFNEISFSFSELSQRFSPNF